VSDLGQRIMAARSGLDPRENIKRIKSAVMDEIKETDPKVRVHVTDYFNHSYTPDFVLDWPQDDRSRYFYIRTDIDPRRLGKDTETLADKSPVLFTLADVVDRNQPELVQLSEAAAQVDTLVTDVPALAEVMRATGESPIAGLASSALLQGGRGVVDDGTAQHLLHTFVSGFDAARATSAPRTVAARDAIQNAFDQRSSRRLTQFLHAVWVGSGGVPSTFPGSADFSPDLTEDAIGLLLDLQDLDDDVFWKRVGRRLSIERVARLGEQRTDNNFHRLVQANLDILTARVCRVVAGQPDILEDHSQLRWVVDRGLLALRGLGVTAYVAAKIDEMTIHGERRPGISGAQLIQRSEQIGRKVEQVGFESAEYRLSYESLRADITQDRTLQEISSAISGANVSTAAILLPESRVLRCDFETLTATGRGSSTFPLADLVEVSLGMLVNLTEDELRWLSDLFAGWREPEGQDTLF